MLFGFVFFIVSREEKDKNNGIKNRLRLLPAPTKLVWVNVSSGTTLIIAMLMIFVLNFYIHITIIIIIMITYYYLYLESYSQCFVQWSWQFYAHAADNEHVVIVNPFGLTTINTFITCALYRFIVLLLRE